MCVVDAGFYVLTYVVRVGVLTFFVSFGLTNVVV